jgi:hypothetical protein
MKALKKILRIVFITAAALFSLGVVYAILTGVHNGKSLIGKTRSVKGKVTSIYEGGTFDAVFKIKGDDNPYYINRGLQYDFNLKDLRRNYIGKDLTISYVSPGYHINELRLGDSVVYTELKE